MSENRDDREQLKSFPQTAYRPAEVRLSLRRRGVKAAVGVLRVKKNFITFTFLPH